MVNSVIRERVDARRRKLEQGLREAERVATAKVSRGNVFLQMGKYATDAELKLRMARLSHTLKNFS